MSNEQISITNNEAAHRFETQIDQQTALLAYRRQGTQLTLIHTEVPAELEGQGIASRLAQAALDYARTEHLEVVPRCSFVAAYIRRHSEYQDLVASNSLAR